MLLSRSAYIELHPTQLKNRKYMASNLLVLDEFGYQTMSREEANLLFRVVNYRYQKGSTIITTNKGIASWPEVLAGDDVLAGVLAGQAFGVRPIWCMMAWVPLIRTVTP